MYLSEFNFNRIILVDGTGEQQMTKLEPIEAARIKLVLYAIDRAMPEEGDQIYLIERGGQVKPCQFEPWMDRLWEAGRIRTDLPSAIEASMTWAALLGL